jgi:16S rRNA (cytosine967-C5)-methyltransferase
MNLRLIAAEVIDEVTDGRSLDQVLPHYLEPIKDARDRAFVQALCYGVCRSYTKLDVMLSSFLEKPMKAKDSDVHALMMVGLYQLAEMRVPAHAAVSETVEAAKSLKKQWARGLVNAVLRAYLRQPNLDFSDDLEALYAHPYWWIDAYRKAWPQDYEVILEANNMHPPMVLRARDREKSLAALNAAGIVANPLDQTQHGIVLAEPSSVEALPGFAEGELSVQDGAAQLAAGLLSLKPGMHVLDACAAPGGKLTHLLEAEPTLTVVAVEKDRARAILINDNLKRHQQTATVITADVKATQQWWDQKPFDCILLDAPCSASGVIRRHPDIKLLRQPEDIKMLAREQTAILKALWPTLAKGGTLLYVTCSVFPEENDAVIASFLTTHPDAQQENLAVHWGVATKHGRQVLTGQHDMDGFYYARLRKLETPPCA